MRTQTKPILHHDDKPEGIRGIVANFPIVKPKVERIDLTQGIKPEDIKDFVGQKEFLQRYQGVKQKKGIMNVETKRFEERAKRTFAHAGISVMTINGSVKLNFENAPELKDSINKQYAYKQSLKRPRQSNGENRVSQTAQFETEMPMGQLQE